MTAILETARADLVAPTRPATKRRRKSNLWPHLPLITVAAVTRFPFYVMVALSGRQGKSAASPGGLSPLHFNFSAYRQALGGGDAPRWILNTAIYSVVLVFAFASLAAYAFAKKRFFGRNVMFWTFIVMLMVP